MQTSYPPIKSADGVLHRLELLPSADDYDAEFLRPSQPVLDFIRALLPAASEFTEVDRPDPSVGAIGDGGVSVQRGSTTYVRLLVPPDPARNYLYCRSDGVGRVEPANPRQLASELQRLAGK